MKKPNWIQRKAGELLGLSYLVDAANPRETFRRPFEVKTIDTISKEVNQYDWLTLLSDSRKLYSNLGPVTGAIDDKAMYSVGRAWCPKYKGKNKAWGKIAEEWLESMWYPMADVRGGAFDFKTDLFLSSVSVDRDGEIYVRLVESDDGWPQIQLIPAHMVGSRSDDGNELKQGPYKGLKIIQGVIVNKYGRAVAYNILSDKPENDEQVSARDMIQVFDPKWCDQVRGFPCFTHALLDLKDLRTVQGYEKMASAMAGRVGIIEKNELGAPDPNDPMNALTRNRSNNLGGQAEVTTQEFGGGEAVYFRSGTGAGLEILKNDRPGAAWESFMDRLIRNACVGAGWPFELTWDAAKLGGANVRLLIAKAMRSVEDRQDLLRPVARRVVGYAVAKAIKNGDLPEDDEWYNWGFTLPARMTADYGRDASADLKDYEAGLRTMTDIVEEEGGNIEEHIETLTEERKKLADAGIKPVGQQQQAAPLVPIDGQEPEDAEIDKPA